MKATRRRVARPYSVLPTEQLRGPLTFINRSTKRACHHDLWLKFRHCFLF